MEEMEEAVEHMAIDLMEHQLNVFKYQKKESVMAKTADLTWKQSQAARGELTQLDRELKDVKKACLDLKQEMNFLPNVYLQQMKNDLNKNISEMNNSKEE